MKTHCKDIARIPDWAYAPLINGDWFGISKKDKKDMLNFMAVYYDAANKLKGGTVIICPTDEQTESYFSWHPAFGLPCCVYDTYIHVVYNEPEPKPTLDQSIVEHHSRPDVKIIIDEFDVIKSCDTLTRVGEKFVASMKIIGASYTNILNNSKGICFEVVR